MNLDEIENSVLIQEIERRFKQRDQTIFELKVVMDKLENMNKKLLEAEENRSKFISIIRNEFNNPLASMISLSKNRWWLCVSLNVTILADIFWHTSFITLFESFGAIKLGYIL